MGKSTLHFQTTVLDLIQSQLLHLGDLEADDGWFMRAANTSTLSNPSPTNKRRRLIMLSVLIEHPTEGLILFETGGGEDYPKLAGAAIQDVFSRVDHDKSKNLDEQIALTGHKIEDVKMVVMGHLHLDHSGGLEHFKGKNVPVYVHELELKHAFYSVATKTDVGVYMPHYLTFDINWVPVYGSYCEIAPGINLRHSPGHTPGLMIMQVNLKESGTWIFTSDQYHVKENFEEDVPQGWLARDHAAWVESHQMIKGLKRRTNGKVVLGHCWETVRNLGLEFAPKAYV
jgi:glyoxylase-like metal-dependent hydrolase (beta-lactamase superfamily II)